MSTQNDIYCLTKKVNKEQAKKEALEIIKTVNLQDHIEQPCN